MKEKYKLKDQRIYGGLLVLFAASYLARQMSIPFVSDHIMNFALTGGILVLTTYPDVIGKGMSKRSLIYAVIFWAIVNIVFEFFIRADVIHLPGLDFRNFNTADPIDAVFGLLGIGVFVYVSIKYGLKEIKSWHSIINIC